MMTPINLFISESCSIKLTDTAKHIASTMKKDDSGQLFSDTSSPRFVNTHSNTMEESIIYLETKANEELQPIGIDDFLSKSSSGDIAIHFSPSFLTNC